METCDECYMNASSKYGYDWFIKVCTKPHLLVWAKLSGYPYWPAKVMSVYEKVLSVQFFGEHERAFVPAKDCYLYSQEDPNPVQPKTFRQQNFANCVAEAAEYIKNIIAKFGQFYYAEFKTLLNPDQLDKHVLDTIAGYGTDTEQDLPSFVAKAAAGGSNARKRNSVDRPNKSVLNAIADMRANDEQIVPKTPQIGISRKMAAKLKSSCIQRSNSVPDIPSLAKSVNAVSREEKHNIAKRKTIEKVQEMYYKAKMPKLFDYRTRYANILENPGILVLHKIDLTTSPRSSQCNTPETNDFVEKTTPKWDDDPPRYIASPRTFMKRTPDMSVHDSDSSTPISPFPPTSSTKPNFMSNSIPPIATSATSRIFNPQPSTSAQALGTLSVLCTNVLEKQSPMMIAPPNAQLSTQPIVAQSSRGLNVDSASVEKRASEMLVRLAAMTRAAAEKAASLQNDYSSIANYANEIINLRATVDNAEADRKPQCVNCGETARLFCTWSTGYCDYPCREQYR